jgi:methyl-accepting chemotaxis protein
MSSMTIGRKLTLGFSAVFLAALALAGGYLYSVDSLASALKTATDGTSKKIFMAAEIEAQLFRIRSCQRGVMLFSMHQLREKAQSNKQELEGREASVGALLGQLKPYLYLPRGQKDEAVLETELPKFNADFQQVAAAALAGDSARALKLYTELTSKSLDRMDGASADLLELQRALMEQGSSQGAIAASQAHWMASILMAAALGCAPFLLLMIWKTSGQLRSVAASLAEGAEQITSASSQVASSSQTLAQGASEQAASLEETAASSEEITSMTRKNAENSATAAALMMEVDQKVSDGNRTLGDMVISMREITASSDKISKIIKVIDEIAFQTNILALNAAVEAARAGEAGMGFAVVADEVRSLAQRSAQAAKDTSALIEESMTKSNEGGERLRRVAEVIQAITESTVKVKTLVDEVSLGSQEQARGIQQISKAIAQMNQVTQANAASAEQTASASEQMSAQAEALQNIARELRAMVDHEDQSHLARPAAQAHRSTATRPNPSKSSPPKPNDLKALRSAASHTHKAGAPAGAADHHKIPLEDDFVNM